MDILTVLVEARNLITKPENWCTSVFKETYPSGGVAYCARGAIYEALGIDDYFAKIEQHDAPYCEELLKEIPTDFIIPSKSDYSTSSKVALYNNSHSHAEVLAIFDKTIARLKRDQTIKELLDGAAVEKEPELA